MKNVLNIVTTLLIIVFLGYQFYMESCENKCDINKETKCSSEEESKECKENVEENNLTLVISTDSTTNIDSLLDEVEKTLIKEENGSDSGTAIINEVIIIDEENETSDE